MTEVRKSPTKEKQSNQLPLLQQDNRNVNPFMPSGIFYLTLWKGPFLYKGCLVSFYHYHLFVEFSEFNANSVDPDRTPRSAASDLGLHRLPVSLLWGAMLKLVKLCTK